MRRAIGERAESSSAFGLQERLALAEIDRVDRARRAHLREWYGIDFGDVENYDVSDRHLVVRCRDVRGSRAGGCGSRSAH